MKQKLKSSQQGIAHLGLLLLVLIVVGVVGGGAYYVYQSNQDEDNSTAQTEQVEDEVPDEPEPEVGPTDEIGVEEAPADDDGSQE